MSIPVYDADQVRSLLPMAECIDLLTDLHASISRGEVALPLRSAVPLPYPPGNDALLVMPGALPTPEVFGAKLLSIYPQNGQAPLPVIQGYVLLFDGRTGSPLAMVEAAKMASPSTIVSWSDTRSGP